MHVCEELRPEQSCAELCGDCIVKGFLTTGTHKTAFVPQRHATPVVTCLLGMTLLQEIQNIICTIDADSHVMDKWTWSFEIEKSIYLDPRSAPREYSEEDEAAGGVGRGRGVAGSRGRGVAGSRGRGVARSRGRGAGRGRGAATNSSGMPGAQPQDAVALRPKRKNVDLLIKVKRDNLCVFYIIGVCVLHVLPPSVCTYFEDAFAVLLHHIRSNNTHTTINTHYTINTSRK